ncbi:MAG: oligosaccharide flippase family protein [Planctomycetota bacterium]
MTAHPANPNTPTPAPAPSARDTAHTDPSPAPAPDAPARPAAPSLMQRIKRGLGWTMSGYLFNQILRLVANAILAHLLLREHFGIVVTVSIFVQALKMFSDVGINAGIVQQEGGDRRDYLDTAYTIKIIRGFLIWIVAAAIAYPVSVIYQEPQLMVVLPVIALSAVIQGFQATSVAVLKRRIHLKALTLINVAQMTVSSVVMIVFALIYPSVWALVAGTLTAALVYTVISYFIKADHRDRIRIDPVALRQILSFGVWIFFSTALTFFAAQADKLLLAGVLNFETMGIFGIALALATFITKLMKQLCARVGFPALSELYRNDFDRFRSRLRRFRKAVVIPSAASCIAIAVLGPLLVDLIYPQTFHAAGWIVVVLCINGIAAGVNSTYGNAFLAMGKTHLITIGVAVQFAAAVGLTLGGYHLAPSLGLSPAVGFIGAMALTEWAIHPVYAVMARRAGIHDLKLDAMTLLPFGLVAGALLVLRDLPLFPGYGG